MAVMEVLRTKESGNGRGSIERRGKAHVEKSKVSHRQERFLCPDEGGWKMANRRDGGAKIASQMATTHQFYNPKFCFKKN